jgi:phosphoribosylamine---glycine ligase
MKILVVGSGAREHALCVALAASPMCDQLYCAPGNAGIAAVAECLPIPVGKVETLASTAKSLGIDFVVVGPEEPLVLGLVDWLAASGIPAFGPTASAAELEGSKGFMKDIAASAGVPTAAYGKFRDAEAAYAFVELHGAPIVIKADGLAAGKGVTIAQSKEEAFKAIDDALIHKHFGAAGSTIVIEEFLDGEEVSFFALCDGVRAMPFASAQDHKAAFDGDKGPNTGGMGAYSPAPIFTADMEALVMKTIIQPTVDAMQSAGRPFKGVLFAGLMIGKNGPKLLEYNVRFGDPECEVICTRLKSDLLPILLATTKGRLDKAQIDWKPDAALTVIMATKGYPGDYGRDSEIKGVEAANALPDTRVYHAATVKGPHGALLANGGRVLAVTASAPTIAEAKKRAYAAVDQIDWPNGFCRRDIGWRAVGK